MSIRTIVEINHDYLGIITDKDIDALFRAMSSCELNARETPHEFMPGIRVLGSRHHSEELTITVK